MRIESALYSSREGLNAHGQAISVVGDNIANSNTVGFKGSRIEFADLLDVSSGVQVQQVRQNQAVGVIEDTGRSLDAAIAGNGFFILSDGAQQYYSRAGNFSLARDGTLTDSNGKSVMGFLEGATTLSEINLYATDVTGNPTSEAGALTGNLFSGLEVKGAAPNAPTTFAQLARESSYMSTLSVYDSLGQVHDVTVAFTKTATDAGSSTWVAQAYLDGSEVGGTPGQPVQLGANATLTFDGTGKIAAANQGTATINATANYANGAAPGAFAINLAQMTQLASGSQLSGVSQDGRAAGNVKDFRFDKDGSIYAILDSGAESLVARVPLASFNNVDGLERVGGNLYVATTDAGTLTTNEAGKGGTGEIDGGALERSTVDLAAQFVDLVLYQRGYQANSQTLSATNDLIKGTIALIS